MTDGEGRGSSNVDRLRATWGRLNRLVRDVGHLAGPLTVGRLRGRRPYLLTFPPYGGGSAGVRACHRLVHELNERGFVAFAAEGVNPGWHEVKLARPGVWLLLKLGDPVVIYPEVVAGNPLGAKHVVRWVLNTPGYLGGETEYPSSELVFSWSTEFYNTDRLLTVDVIEHELFNSDCLPAKTIDCYYLGKAAFRGVQRTATTEGMTEITRDWPPTRQEVADLLRHTRVLYTYDHATMLALEALLCGCRVVLLPEDQDFTLADAEAFMGADREAQLSRFIEETQGPWSE